MVVDNTRAPASVATVGGEIAIFTFIGNIVTYFVGAANPDMPEEIKQSMIGLCAAGGPMVLSALRTRRFHRAAG